MISENLDLTEILLQCLVLIPLRGELALLCLKLFRLTRKVIVTNIVCPCSCEKPSCVKINQQKYTDTNSIATKKDFNMKRPSTINTKAVGGFRPNNCHHSAQWIPNRSHYPWEAETGRFTIKDILMKTPKVEQGENCHRRCVYIYIYYDMYVCMWT